MNKTVYIDPSEINNKKCIEYRDRCMRLQELAEKEAQKISQYEEDHKDDELREKIKSVSDILISGNLNINFVDTKISFRNIDSCDNKALLSDKQLLEATAMVLEDRAKGYIVYTEETDDRIITEIIPLKYIQTLEYTFTANINVSSSFSTDIAFTLKKDALTEPEFVYGEHIADGNIPVMDEYFKRRYLIHIVKEKCIQK